MLLRVYMVHSLCSMCTLLLPTATPGMLHMRTAHAVARTHRKTDRQGGGLSRHGTPKAPRAVWICHASKLAGALHVPAIHALHRTGRTARRDMGGHGERLWTGQQLLPAGFRLCVRAAKLRRREQRDL